MLCDCSVDATEEPNSGPRLGRLVNHGDKPKDRNARMKVLTLKNQPVLCLFSTKRISAGEQILYDYGIPLHEVVRYSLLLRAANLQT